MVTLCIRKGRGGGDPYQTGEFIQAVWASLSIADLEITALGQESLPQLHQASKGRRCDLRRVAEIYGCEFVRGVSKHLMRDPTCVTITPG